MLGHKSFVTLFFIAFCTLNSNAQLISSPDSLRKATELSLNLKLHYKPIQLAINSSEIARDTRTIYVFNQIGMYEQYCVDNTKSYKLQSFKAYYPNGLINYNGNNSNRDSFNPHGSNNIGSALINGFINGVLLGHNY